jgi:hypothetical protein
VQELEIPSDAFVGEVSSLESLPHIRGTVFDTKDETMLVSKNGVCFRYSKPTLPRFIKIENLELNPDAFPVKCLMIQKAMFDFARREGMDVLEAKNEFFIIASGGMVFHCAKDEKK